MSERQLMQTVAGEVRAYFAPVTRSSSTATVFDPSGAGFDLSSPPSPWIDLGWIRNFKRTASEALQPLRMGKTGIAQMQLRTLESARLEFDFCDWGKLQMLLASGSQHYNILATAASGAQSACGGTPVAAAAILAGSTASSLLLSTSALSGFAVGDLVAADVDYSAQTGYVGTGIAGGYVADPNDVQRDVNYVRRATLNVGRVTAVTATALTLEQPLPGGAPLTGAGVQKVTGYVDREGPNYSQEWSALFVPTPFAGGRICYYYPLLQTAAAAAETPMAPGDAALTALHASFIALPVDDTVDSQQAVSYRYFLPLSGSPVY
jgi:hypothetical protein